MSKETFWFSHDFNARNDPKIQKLVRRHGMAGYGIFWCIVEMLQEQDGYLPLSDCEDFAYSLRIENDIFYSVLNDFGLFQKDDARFWSMSALDRIAIRKAKSNKAKESAAERWRRESERRAIAEHPQSEGNANALRTQSEGNAIKEKKEKERTERKKQKEDAEYAAADAATQQLFQSFKAWVKTNAPRVEEMKEPFSFTDWQKATKLFGKFGDTLKEMHNYEPLLKKSRSAYLTLIKWRKNNFGGSGNSSVTHPNAPVGTTGMSAKDQKLIWG